MEWSFLVQVESIQMNHSAYEVNRIGMLGHHSDPAIPFQAFVEFFRSVFQIVENIPVGFCQGISGLSSWNCVFLQHCLSSLDDSSVAIVTSKYFVNAVNF